MKKIMLITILLITISCSEGIDYEKKVDKMLSAEWGDKYSEETYEILIQDIKDLCNNDYETFLSISIEEEFGVTGSVKWRVYDRIETDLKPEEVGERVQYEVFSYDKYMKGIEPHYSETYVIGGDKQPILLVNNPDAKNPTFEELMNFLSEDTTYKQEYDDSFVCADFAEMFHNNSEKAGWKCAYIVIEIGGYSNCIMIGGEQRCVSHLPFTYHTLNAFDTSDEGIIYIDATGTYHRIFTLKEGYFYLSEDIEGGNPVSMGTVEKIETIQW